ncbi:MAG: FAD-dependent oxidoreductase [Anaerolineales bacterium]|nr:FAD-dependent oxidoreductase [Anaerolineales bacterium]
MVERSCDAVVIGCGAAGMAAAAAMRAGGLAVAVVEREEFLGGILMQCIHNGFGIHEFGADLTGPEFAERLLAGVRQAGIDIYPDTTVMEISGEEGAHTVTACGKAHGVVRLACRAVVLAMGCRERNRGNVAIGGSRPAGVYTAGLAQRLMNLDGFLPGRRAVVIGSGDIGLIMARRLTLVGAKVPAVVEILPYPSGLARNISQCLNDFSIPLHLAHVVSKITGRERVDGVEVTPLAGGVPDYAKTFRLECDTVLLSVGLIPENELSRKAGVSLSDETGGPRVDSSLMTGVPGIFACGNVLHVHDLVDFVVEEGRRCGQAVCRYLAGERPPQFRLAAGTGVRSVTPNYYSPGRENVIYLRALTVKNDAILSLRIDGAEVKRKRLPHVQPSEMIRVPLKPADFPEPDPRGENVLEAAIE